MSNEPGLFDMPNTPAPSPLEYLPISQEQVQAIREAFDEAGIEGQDERRSLVNSVITREVATLRELHSVEVRRVLTSIKRYTHVKPKASGSVWDNREEDTWIDKL
ncbi:hypothetical protein [Paenarthrobacter ureafaciens]|uniref:hypothetical protein n=1 Tax=Paenarthrobacter ureafaciens TaxID=37931 RepID=UPI001FB4DB2A|nr:hypothetical protein [Paenarthrobacter ureafaciens]UOD83478.1 hypothetical protein MQZ73_20795 [Paenarthrobacter ureafaciens]